MSIDASELNGYDQIFKDALGAAVAEYNSVVPGLTLFQSPTYSGAPGDITVRVIDESERKSVDWNLAPKNGQWVDTIEQIEGEPGCVASYCAGAELRIGYERYYYDSQSIPPVQHIPWGLFRLIDVFLHELSHGAILNDHIDRWPESGWLCPDLSSNCRGGHRTPSMSLSQYDIHALGCI
jgi:hypothetical protein